jgi:surfeit locus 1 family protein
MSEPHGGFLRANDPAAGRWYSRDVSAIARARGLGHIAPFFIDADASPNPGGYPRGGLTVVAFRNDHLVYALTWFALAGLSVIGVVLVLRSERDT